MKQAVDINILNLILFLLIYYISFTLVLFISIIIIENNFEKRNPKRNNTFYIVQLNVGYN